jgi:hypothetical protein
MFDADDARNSFKQGVFDHFPQGVFESAAADAGSGQLHIDDAVFKLDELDIAAISLDIGADDVQHRLDFFEDFFVGHDLTRFTNRVFSAD